MNNTDLKLFDAHQDILEALPDSNNRPKTSFDDLTQNCRFVVASIFVNPDTKQQDYRQEITRQLNTYLNAIEKTPTLFLVTSKDDLSIRPDQTGIVLHLEGLTNLGKKDLKFISELVEKGVRSFGLTWNFDNDFAGSCAGTQSLGLTRLGRDFVRFCHNNHLAVDAAHASKQTTDDCLLFEKPIVYSHGACAAVLPNPRNIDDAHIKAIGQIGGGVGIFIARRFLTNHPQGQAADFLK